MWESVWVQIKQLCCSVRTDRCATCDLLNTGQCRWTDHPDTLRHHSADDTHDYTRKCVKNVKECWIKLKRSSFGQIRVWVMVIDAGHLWDLKGGLHGCFPTQFHPSRRGIFSHCEDDELVNLQDMTDNRFGHFQEMCRIRILDFSASHLMKYWNRQVPAKVCVLPTTTSTHTHKDLKSAEWCEYVHENTHGRVEG